MIMTAVKPLEETLLPVSINMSISVCTYGIQVTPALVGCVLAQDVYASHDVPATPTTNVDGYAVVCEFPPMRTFLTYNV